MARTILQIQTELKAAFVAAPELSSAYELDTTKTFDEQFSPVSIEAIKIYIVSYAIWTLEKIMDAFSTEVDARIADAYITSLKWYWKQALNYREGGALEFSEAKYLFEYKADAEGNVIGNQIVKFASVKEIKSNAPTIPVELENITLGALTDEQKLLLIPESTRIWIVVAGANKVALTEMQLAGFAAYMERIGAAGTHYQIETYNAEEVGFTLTIRHDPLLLTNNGTATIGDNTNLINSAIATYLDNLDYGGAISTTGLIAALMAVPGVVDLRYQDCQRLNTTSGLWEAKTDVYIPATKGAFKLKADKMTVTYIYQ